LALPHVKVDEESGDAAKGTECQSNGNAYRDPDDRLRRVCWMEFMGYAEMIAVSRHRRGIGQLSPKPARKPIQNGSSGQGIERISAIAIA
jgi:hypothetical protein